MSAILAGLPRPGGAGRFAWHHKAVVFSLMRREKTPRLFLRIPSGRVQLGPLPADAARAKHPAPPGHVKVGKNDYMTRIKPESTQRLRGEKGQEGKGRKEKRGHFVYLYLLSVLCGEILEGK